MKRRDFLVGAGGVALVTVTGTYYYINRDIEYDQLIAEPQSLSLIWDTETIISIGNDYRAHTPNENSEQALAKKLLKGNSGSDKEMINNLNEKVTEDFKNHDVVVIDGWILSKTEARQCGLLSFNQPKK